MKRSFLIVSRTLAVIFLLAIVACGVIVPRVVEAATAAHDTMEGRMPITEGGELLITVLAYLMLALAAFAVVMLWRLLGVVARGEVFTEQSTNILFFVIAACFGEAVLFLMIGYYFYIAIGIALAAALLAFSLLVVREVLKEATRIKYENDFTV